MLFVLFTVNCTTPIKLPTLSSLEKQDVPPRGWGGVPALQPVQSIPNMDTYTGQSEILG